jgi:type I restriction enzyme R subunit
LTTEPEQLARHRIDQLLESAGWKVQDYKNLNLGEGLGVAVREFPIKSLKSTDYLLFIERKAAGVLEAKPQGMTLSGVSEQSSAYLHNIPEDVPCAMRPLPFSYESTGDETYFRDLRDPDSRSRSVFSFHRPETLRDWLSQPRTLRWRLKNSMPELMKTGLRDCQIRAIENLEKSFAMSRPRALIQMPSGSGKTFAAVNFIYRLIKFAGARRILFLVDRRSLGIQTDGAFRQFVTPDDGRKFTELYNVQHMTQNKIDPVSKVCITTIQRLYSMLEGEEFNPELEEPSMFETWYTRKQAVEVKYNPEIPIETFDFIVTDECHRSIYHLWRQVLEYFDAFIVGLTATPSKQTFGFFNQNLVMEYPQERAIVDNICVGYEVYRIKTKITNEGSRVESGFFVDKRDKLTRKRRMELLDEDLEYKAEELDRSVVATDQIRTVIRTFKEKLFTEIFPGRKEVPKTLIFAKDDTHAEDIVQIVREEFGKGNDFCKKITYRTTGEKPENLIKSFSNSYNPRIAVTVDMISTGTDIRALECLLFMRDVKSRIFFEQMKGRGARTISPTDLQAVTPDAEKKTHYIIVDAVGVCESDKTESRPLERKRSVPFDKLLLSIASGNREEDAISSLAYRLSLLDRDLTEEERMKVQELSGGKSLKDLENLLLDSLDEDKRIEKARELFRTDEPTEEEIEKAGEEMAQAACSAFDKPEVRNLLIDLRQRSEQTIDYISKDIVLFSGYDEKAKENAETIIKSFKKFIEENKDELIALQIIYGKPYSKRELTYDAIRKIAEKIEKPPYRLTPEQLWRAYEQLEKSKVKRASPPKLLTNIISLIRFQMGELEILEPFNETVNRRYEEWLASQEENGKKFTPEQKEWLSMIKDQVAASLHVEIEDLEYPPFYEKGGAIRFYSLFGANGEKTLKELNEVLIAEAKKAK